MCGLHCILYRRIRIDEYIPFWLAKRAEVLQRAGLPANSSTCPEHRDSSSSSASTIGLAVGVAVGGGCLVATISGALFMYRHKLHRGHLGAKGGLPSAAAASQPPSCSAHLHFGPVAAAGPRNSTYSSSTHWVGNSPFAAFLAQALQPPPATNTTGSTQQHSASGGPPTAATSATTSCYSSKSASASGPQASDGNSGDNLGPCPGMALRHEHDE